MTRQAVPFFDARREYLEQKDEFDAAAVRVLESGRYILGPEVEALEKEAATYLSAKFAVGVANGTDAIELALRAIGVREGDAVLTTPFTFFGTVSAILAVGADPVFADIDPVSYNLDPERVRDVLEGRSEVENRRGSRPDRIKALLPVHLFGQPADMGPLIELSARHGARVVEDAAQAFGTEYAGERVGKLGDAGCFSFFPTKNLGGFGDGGLVTTDDEAVWRKIRLLRSQGSHERYIHEIVGRNSRLDELQAALLRIRLRGLDAALARRRSIADAYSRAFESSCLGVPTEVAGRRHGFHVYTLSVPRQRDELRAAAAERGVQTAVYYSRPLHEQQALERLQYRAGDFPEAEAASKRVLALPIFPSMSDGEVREVSTTILECADRLGDEGP